MAFFLSKPKLAAAATSMHQFCPVVRGIFRSAPGDGIVEAVTVFLYGRVAEDVFGRRFATHLKRKLRGRYRFATSHEIEASVHRIGCHHDMFTRVAKARRTTGTTHDRFTEHVQSVIKAVLAEAGLPFDDAELVRDTFPHFQHAVRTLKTHLKGIHCQSQYMMR